MLNKNIIDENLLNNGSQQKIWDKIFANKEWGKYPNENVIRFIARNFYHKQRDKTHILELGFGTGANLWYCAREGFKISGCELSQNGADKFLKRMRDENLTHNIEQIEVGDYFDSINHFKNQYDCILDVYALAYSDLKKSKSVIEKSIGVLKPGGCLLSITPTFNNLGFEIDATLPYHMCKPTEGGASFTGTIRYCDDKDINDLYNGNNYRITNVTIQQQRQGNLSLYEVYVVEVAKI